MQETVLQEIDSKRDITLLSPTGTGKTLVFILKILSEMDQNIHGTQALIITPTRELALQIETVFRIMKTNFTVVCCYGGNSFQSEKNKLKGNPALIIGTPGRISDHIFRKTINTDIINNVVLDEFDKSLEIGFEEEMKFIIESLTLNISIFLTSATALNTYPDFLKLKNIQVFNFLKDSVNLKIEYFLLQSTPTEKLENLLALIQSIGNSPTLIFCNQKEITETVADYLLKNNINNTVLHGGFEQDDREKALMQFQNGSVNYLVATDLASRGIDKSDIETVIHYQLPISEDSYIHRNGRTGRAEKTGKVFLMVENTKNIPSYINAEPFQIKSSGKKVDFKPTSCTLYISGGKRDKINKGDIVGFLIKICDLKSEDIGQITVKDKASYVAVPIHSAKTIIDKSNTERIKNKKVKIEAIK